MGQRNEGGPLITVAVCDSRILLYEALSKAV